MTTGLNNFALDIQNGSSFKAISDAGTKAAILTIATQMQGFRSQGTVTGAVGHLRDLIEDILRGQVGQVTVNALPPAASAELLINDATTQTAFGTVRTYLSGLTTVTNPAIGQLKAKQDFGPLCFALAQAV